MNKTIEIKTIRYHNERDKSELSCFMATPLQAAQSMVELDLAFGGTPILVNAGHVVVETQIMAKTDKTHFKGPEQDMLFLHALLLVYCMARGVQWENTITKVAEKLTEVNANTPLMFRTMGMLMVGTNIATRALVAYLRPETDEEVTRLAKLDLDELVSLCHERFLADMAEEGICA